MNTLRKELEDEEQGLRNISRSKWQRPVGRSNNGKKHSQIFYVSDKDLENWDDIDLDEVDEFTSTSIIDRRFDHISEGEISNIVACLKSGLDVSVCDNAFTIPANAPLHDMEITVCQRCRRMAEAKTVRHFTEAFK